MFKNPAQITKNDLHTLLGMSLPYGNPCIAYPGLSLRDVRSCIRESCAIEDNTVVHFNPFALLSALLNRNESVLEYANNNSEYFYAVPLIRQIRKEGAVLTQKSGQTDLFWQSEVMPGCEPEFSKEIQLNKLFRQKGRECVDTILQKIDIFNQPSETSNGAGKTTLVPV